jgi:hypothetical protein
MEWFNRWRRKAIVETNRHKDESLRKQSFFHYKIS